MTQAKSDMSVPEDINKTYILCVKRSVLDDDNDPTIIKLKNPKTGQPCLYLLSADKKQIQEIMIASEDKRSWMIDKTLVASNQLHIVTPIDPLFLILPYLTEKKHCSPLDQIIEDLKFPDVESLLNCSGIKNINKIADSKGDASLNAFIYNENKTLDWLKMKVEKLVKLLQEKNIHVAASQAVSANFVKSEKTTDSAENYTKYAHGIISEYLSEELTKKLADFLGLPNVPEQTKPNNTKKRKTRDEPQKDEEEENKKKIILKDECEGDTFVEKVKEKVQKTSAKEKARAKAALGSKNISSFFKKT